MMLRLVCMACLVSLALCEEGVTSAPTKPAKKARVNDASVNTRIDVVKINGITGFTTYRLYLILNKEQINLYAMSGTEKDGLRLPPAWQVEKSKDPLGSLGSTIGMVNPAYLSYSKALKFDSWVTLGEGAKSPSNIGFGKKLVQWSKTQGVDADNGAIFFMNPQDGPSNNKKGPKGVLVAQLTISSKHDLLMKARFTGRYTQSAAAKHGKGTWNVADIIFTNSKCNGDLYKSFLNKCPHQKFQKDFSKFKCSAKCFEAFFPFYDACRLSNEYKDLNKKHNLNGFHSVCTKGNNAHK